MNSEPMEREQLLERIRQLESEIEVNRRSRTFFDTLVENIPCMIFVKEARELRFVHFNRAGEKLLGFSREELLGKNDFDFFPREQAEYFIAKDRSVFETREVVEISEEPIQTRHHGTRTLRTWKVPIFDVLGEPQYLLGISEDITDRKRTEQERDRLKSQREMSDDFVSALSHDLRAPLTAAKASAELIRRFPGRMELHGKLTSAVIDNLNRADRMIRDLLDANLFEAGKKLQLKISDCDLVQIGKTVLAESSLIHPTRFELEAPESLEGRWAEDELRRALENLCSNASKYGSKETPVTLRIIPMGHSVEIRVHNFGGYISEEKRSRLFERFYRANEDTNRGWGLGLIVVKGVAESHGGSVRVESDPEAGTTFVMELPRYVQL